MSGASRRTRAQSIGASVSDTSAETRMVMTSDMANSRNSRPTISLMNRSGIRTAISDRVSAMMVKPISFEPARAASSGLSPASLRRAIFSTITIASSTTKPVATAGSTVRENPRSS